MTEEGRWGGNLVEYLSSMKSNPNECSAPPRAKDGPEPSPHAFWEYGFAIRAVMSS